MSISDSVPRYHSELLEKSIPPYSYFIFLVMLMIMGNLLGGGLVYLSGLVSGQSIQELLAGSVLETVQERNYFRWINLISHLFTFTFPAILTVWILNRSWWAATLRLTSAPKLSTAYLGGLFIILTFPLAQFSYWLNQQLPLPAWATSMEESAGETLQSMLVMNSTSELVFNIVVIAIIPAIGEELVFRGIVQDRLSRFFSKGWMAIWLSALFFSAFHLQFEGFLPRLILGAGLGYLFYWTRNLWIPIIAHMLINGLQLLITYFNEDNADALTPSKSIIDYWPVVILSTLLLIISGYFLQSTNKVYRSSSSDGLT